MALTCSDEVVYWEDRINLSKLLTWEDFVQENFSE